GVAGLAAIPKLLEEGFMDRGEVICHVVTGNGLKDIQSAMKAKGTLISVEPHIEDVREKLHQRTSQEGD
ncbi:threonine synthase, partial [Candidatus Hakubella thermalkaliphila]